MINKLWLISILIALFVSQILFAQTNGQFESVPGGVAIIDLDVQERPEAFFNNKRVIVTGEPGAWQAIVGLPLRIR
ncbi:MAG: hypothetical protein GTO60_03650, partial [Gammaproteobacteria bacterium]|nr:hypothetical protein [Gammaproteobacteria bacterium]